MLELDLKIKEAQADGNAEREASLNALKNWSEAIVKYEGDLDKTARDVNATLKERNRLRDEEASKQRSAIQAELQHVETMTFGTEEAKAKAEWMDEYNRRIAQGATDEEAKRFANAATFKTQTESSFGGGGGGSNLSAVVSQAMSQNERIGAMRGAANAAASNAAAQRFESAGQFRSAVRAQDRAQRRVDRAMESARVKDILGGKNMGEAYKEYQSQTGMGHRMSREEFEKSIREQAKSPEERARDEEEAKKKGEKQGQEGEKSSDPMQTVTDIYKLLTERLPIRVLAA